MLCLGWTESFNGPPSSSYYKMASNRHRLRLRLHLHDTNAFNRQRLLIPYTHFPNTANLSPGRKICSHSQASISIPSFRYSRFSLRAISLVIAQSLVTHLGLCSCPRTYCATHNYPATPGVQLSFPSAYRCLKI